MAEFEDDEDFDFLNSMPLPGGAPAQAPVINNASSGQEEEKKGEDVEEDDPNAHKLEYEDIEITENAEGKKVLNGFLTFESEIGRGAFCSVIKTNGYYEASDETVPYALKIYKTTTLNGMVQAAQGLGIRKLKDQVIDEVEFWGKLKHDNIVKAFIWYEDYSAEPHNKMYLMLQFADMGEVASGEQVGGELKYVPN